ncbi:MAG: hypothetical protein N2170_06805 [Bacteroidia bacterium]|nr:hypothetical protein [Bacteroidia bacterium]
MRKAYTFLWLAGLVVSLLAFKGANSSQPPIGYTGAPGDNGTCRNCHSGGTGTTTLTLTQGGQPISTYVPGGSAMTLTVSVSNPSAQRYGFQLTAIGQAPGQENVPNQGLSTSGHVGVVLQTGSGGRKYVGHQNDSPTGQWTFTWTPPSVNVGTITWYVAGNAVNGNGSTSGDTPTSQTFSMQPDLTSAVVTSQPLPFQVKGHTICLSSAVAQAKLYSLEGRWVATYAGEGIYGLPGEGIFLLELTDREGRSTIYRIGVLSS